MPQVFLPLRLYHTPFHGHACVCVVACSSIGRSLFLCHSESTFVIPPNRVKHFAEVDAFSYKPNNTISFAHSHNHMSCSCALITNNHLCTFYFFVFFCYYWNTFFLPRTDLFICPVYLPLSLSLPFCLCLTRVLLGFFSYMQHQAHTTHICLFCSFYICFNTCYNQMQACASQNNFNIAN